MIIRGNRPALRYVMPGNMTRFNLKAGEHALQDGHDIAERRLRRSGQERDRRSEHRGHRADDGPGPVPPVLHRADAATRWFNVMEIPLTR